MRIVGLPQDSTTTAYPQNPPETQGPVILARSALEELAKTLDPHTTRSRQVNHALLMPNGFYIDTVVDPATGAIHVQKYSLQKLEERLPGGIKFDDILMDRIEEAMRNAEQARGKDIVLFIGDTGSGKSTTIGALAGKELEERPRKDVLDEPRARGKVICLKNPGPDDAEIGHTKQAQTLLPRLYQNRFCDCPGFKDNRSTEHDLIASIATKLIASQATSVKIALVVELSYLKNKGTGLRSVLHQTLGKFMDEFYTFQNSFLLLITHNRDETGLWDNGAIINELEGFLSGNETDQEMVRFLLRENGQYIQVFNPIEQPGTRDEILRKLDRFRALNPGHLNFPYSAEALTSLLETFLPIAGGGFQSISNFFSQKEKREDLRRDIETEKRDIDTLQSVLDSLNDQQQQGENPAQQIRQTYEKMKASAESDIATAQEEVQLFVREIEEFTAKITTLKTDEEPVKYWGETIDEPAQYKKDIERRDVPVEQGGEARGQILQGAREGMKQGGTLGNFGGPVGIGIGAAIGVVVGAITAWLRRDKPKPVKEQARMGESITKTFKYEGKVKIAELLQEGEGTWSDRNGGLGQTHFSATYTSYPGQPAKATVQIFAAKKNTPATQEEIATLESRKAALEDRLRGKEARIEDAKARVASAEAMIEDAEAKESRQAKMKADKEHREGKLNECRQKLEELKRALDTSKQQIETQRKKYESVDKFIKLTDDKMLQNDYSIKEFLKIYNRYKEEIHE